MFFQETLVFPADILIEAYESCYLILVGIIYVFQYPVFSFIDPFNETSFIFSVKRTFTLAVRRRLLKLHRNSLSIPGLHNKIQLHYEK